jgi:hypothetical protein
MAEVSPDALPERNVPGRNAGGVELAVTIGLGAELRGAVGDEEGTEIGVHSGLLGWVGADNVMSTMSCDTPPHIRRSVRLG